ncbi:hypothetical protein [Arthrobacter sp. R-11]|uniref:hypothetical protein n=1 Tax=Arthrobacter sp. R-11 TaxID=3404053 RepID=UPI003CF0E7FF
MSPRIVGESGVVLDLPEAKACGLVRDGYAKWADGEPPANVNPEGQAPGTPPPGSQYGTGDGPDGAPPADGKPRGNASRDEWVTYALANGKTEDDLQGLKQGEIRALFGDTSGDGGQE